MIESLQHSNIDESEMAQIHGAIHFHENAIARVRARLNAGPGLEHCEECGAEIPLARRQVVSGCRTCISCQEELEKL